MVDADGRMDDDGRTTEHLYTRISVPCEPNGSGELKVIVSHSISHLLNHRVWLLVRAILKTVHNVVC